MSVGGVRARTALHDAWLQPDLQGRGECPSNTRRNRHPYDSRGQRFRLSSNCLIALTGMSGVPEDYGGPMSETPIVQKGLAALPAPVKGAVITVSDRCASGDREYWNWITEILKCSLPEMWRGRERTHWFRQNVCGTMIF